MGQSEGAVKRIAQRIAAGAPTLADTLSHPDCTLTYLGPQPPETILAGSGIPVEFRCACGTKFKRRPKHLRSPFLCFACSRAPGIAAIQSLQAKCTKVSDVPELLALWHDEASPDEICARSGERFRFKCPICAHEWTAFCHSMYRIRTNPSRGCCTCAISMRPGPYTLGRNEPWEHEPAELYLVKFDSFYGFGFSANDRRKHSYGKDCLVVAYATGETGRSVREAEMKLISLCPEYRPEHPVGVKTEWLPLADESVRNWKTIADEYGLTIHVIRSEEFPD